LLILSEWLVETGVISEPNDWIALAVLATMLLLPTCGAILQGIIERKVEAH
jgi:hypothetical protein